MNNIKFIIVVSTLILAACSSTNTSVVKDGPLIDQGYGTVASSQSTTAISQINIDENEAASVSWMELFQRAAGVTVKGRGNNLSIRIRAKKSINGSQEPLFVVNNTPVGQGFTNVAFIDPTQVKSISILKDAASASAYGSRGANGVILIKLK